MEMIMILSTPMMRKGVMPTARMRSISRPSYPPKVTATGTDLLKRNRST